MLQCLRVGVFGGALDQALADCVDVLQLRLNAVHLLSLHGLKDGTREAFIISRFIYEAMNERKRQENV